MLDISAVYQECWKAPSKNATSVCSKRQVNGSESFPVISTVLYVKFDEKYSLGVMKLSVNSYICGAYF